MLITSLVNVKFGLKSVVERTIYKNNQKLLKIIHHKEKIR